MRGLILDMDGVLWRGETALPGLVRLFRTLDELSLPFALATNSAARTPAETVAKLAGYGVEVSPSRVLTSARVAALDLGERHPGGAAVHVVGEVGLAQELRAAGLHPSDGSNDCAAVVVGLDREFTYDKLAVASALVRAGADFVATNTDSAFPVESGLMPGAGAIVAAIATASGRDPRVVGKPARAMFLRAAQMIGAPAAEIVVVGDRLDTDIAGALAAGMRSILVTTGVDGAEDVARSPWQPTLVMSGLDDLADWLTD